MKIQNLKLDIRTHIGYLIKNLNIDKERIIMRNERTFLVIKNLTSDLDKCRYTTVVNLMKTQVYLIFAIPRYS